MELANKRRGIFWPAQEARFRVWMLFFSRFPCCADLCFLDSSVSVLVFVTQSDSCFCVSLVGKRLNRRSNLEFGPQTFVAFSDRPTSEFALGICSSSSFWVFEHKPISLGSKALSLNLKRYRVHMNSQKHFVRENMLREMWSCIATDIALVLPNSLT